MVTSDAVFIDMPAIVESVLSSGDVRMLFAGISSPHRKFDGLYSKGSISTILKGSR